jgi:hypothetical protein
MAGKDPELKIILLNTWGATVAEQLIPQKHRLESIPVKYSLVPESPAPEVKVRHFHLLKVEKLKQFYIATYQEVF